MRGIGSFLLGILGLVVLAAIGVGIYDAGLQQGIAQSADLPAGAVPYAAYGYGYHGFGFGILGLLFPILFLFLIFGLIRAAFRGGRGGWGRGYGHGYGKWGPGPWMSGPDRESWMQERDSRVADWHRRLHEETGPGGPTASSASASSSGSDAGSSGGSSGQPA